MSAHHKNEARNSLAGPLVWPFSLFPWQQQFTFQNPVPYMMPPPNISNYYPLIQEPNQQQNFSHLSAPLNEDKENPQENQKRTSRRYSDPGPYLPSAENIKTEVVESSNEDNSTENVRRSSEENKNKEAMKDSTFLSLVEELNAARTVNCQLMLELNRTKLQLEILQSEQNRSSESQPGYISALAQRLFDAHQLRSEAISHLNQAAASRFEENHSPWNNGYRSMPNTFREKFFEPEDSEQQLLKDKEMLFSQLQATERKLQQLRSPPQQFVRDEVFHHYPRRMDNLRPSSSSEFGSASRASAFRSASSAASASEPASIDDVELNVSLKNSLMGVSPPHRRREIGGAPVPSQGRDAAATYDASVSEIQRQMSLLERERRQLHQEYQSSMAALRSSEERATKLERLVGVLRKKLDSSAASTASVNSEAAGTSLEHPRAGRYRLTSIDGPESLPSYTVGPITQL